MVDRLVEPEKAVASYDRDYGFPGTVKMPERYKFGWLRELVDLLQPLEAATREMCSETVTVADVIPMVTAIHMQLQKRQGGNVDVDVQMPPAHSRDEEDWLWGATDEP